MIFTTIAFSVVFALLFAILLAYIFRKRGPGPAGGVFFIFLLILTFTWAIGAWVEPIGPVTWGVPWLSYLIIAFFITLLIGALIPSSRSRSTVITKEEVDKETREEEETATAVGITFGVFFWFLIIALLVIGLLKITS